MLNETQLLFIIELSVFIAAEFAWKPLQPMSMDQVVSLGSSSNASGASKDPRPIQQVDLEMTLTRRWAERMRVPEIARWVGNEASLTDDAFRPKTYTVRLETGNFLAAVEESEFTTRHALRLVFDPSPYPPRSEWKEPEGGPDANRPWEWTKFYGRESPELKMWTPPRTWGETCVVC